jgi:hypothetical protein
MANKSWVRSKELNQYLWSVRGMSKELTRYGGWIVNAEKKRFCHKWYS